MFGCCIYACKRNLCTSILLCTLSLLNVLIFGKSFQHFVISVEHGATYFLLDVCLISVFMPISALHVGCANFFYWNESNISRWEKWCCDITVDSTTPAPWNGACTERWISKRMHYIMLMFHNCFYYKTGLLQKGLYYFILSGQNKLVEIGCRHKKMLVLHFEQIVMSTQSFKNTIVEFCVH